MAASLVSIPEYVRDRAAGRTSGQWTNQELAELTRVVSLLAQAGLPVETDSGLTDEGDPWMVFVRPDTEDVIAHFARMDGRFVAAGTNAGVVVEGDSFRDVVDKILARQPLLMSAAGPMSSFGGRHGGSAERMTGTGDRAAPRGTDSGDNVTTLFTHPSVVLAAFVATALMQARKTADTSGLSLSPVGAGKTGLDSRTSGPGSPGANTRGQLQDSLTALSTGDGAGSSSSGQSGFMLHSAGMASAMAMVVAAITPASTNPDGSTNSVLGTLTRVGRSEDGKAHGSSGADAARTAKAAMDPDRNGGLSARAPQSADGLDQANQGGDGSAGPVILAAPASGSSGAPSLDGIVALAAPEVVVDADLFFADLLGPAGDMASAAQPGTGRTAPDSAAAGTGGNNADLANGKAASNGPTGSTSDTASKTRAAAEGESGSGTVSAGDPSADEAAGRTDVATKIEAREASGDLGKPAGDLEFGSIIWVGTVTPGGGDLVDISGVDGDTDVSAGGDDDPLLADTSPGSGGGSGGLDTVDAPETGLPVEIYSRWAAPVHRADTAEPFGAADGIVYPGRQIVYSGGLMEVESFDPIFDTLAVTGHPANLGFYQVIYTYEGIEFRFDAENVISLLGVAPEDLGYG